MNDHIIEGSGNKYGDAKASFLYSKFLQKVLKSSLSSEVLMDMTDDDMTALVRKLDTLSGHLKLGAKKKGNTKVPPVWNVISTSYADAVERDICVRLSSDPNFSTESNKYPNAESMVGTASRNAVVN
mmetsp:Transcript_41976/g.98359  ORF Transcript_41976/g.98359 Transcript_41976/m.98359 type:complete len:127 (-) Transcript_41976:1435-1815(-)|eukprot:CAMPEP_0113306158 /NCGR_PEP_ID=MMETSP0010_2-20120614/5518_1 /TAXON_ID=216773 ORGANISM="Corethron hystrix, Strain 308" /NCGR_SAMPLE_ID=MMETSP0010_2 /ASSEMBLY_ACC=CAM_ASM_000155 /LENGTH=126 /DNA_ID=CAMNT_0000160763 /DNA_START=137 /DNA_END=517 /DNA_ORIENTATION=+ /assembly_acc=CAM_ASM_000155